MKRLSKRAAESSEELWKGDYLSVRLMDSWYEYLHDGNGKLVVVLGYRRVAVDAWEYLGRYEKCPPHDDGIALCALTGGIEKDEEPLTAALRELKEESGIVCDPKIESLGTIRPSKASDSTAYLFSVDLQEVPDKDKYVGEGDGTEGEKNSYCKWVSSVDVLKSKDALLITAMARQDTGYDFDGTKDKDQENLFLAKIRKHISKRE